VEEVFDAGFVADEPEAFVDEESRDCPGRHNPKPSVRPPGKSQGVSGRDGITSNAPKK
jgi:hypothetical protein